MVLMEEPIWIQTSVPENFESTVWFKELSFYLVKIHNNDWKHLKLQIEGLTGDDGVGFSTLITVLSHSLLFQ